MIEKVVEHDHHQRNDQPQRQILVKRIQMILPPAEKLPVGRLNSGVIQRFLGFTKNRPIVIRHQGKFVNCLSVVAHVFSDIRLPSEANHDHLLNKLSLPSGFPAWPVSRDSRLPIDVPSAR
jgi:hypothetical protein